MNLLANIVNEEEIRDEESWRRLAPPKRGELQWRIGRSARELAVYLTGALPGAPAEIVQCLGDAGVDTDRDFHWRAEYVTDFAGYGLGKGEGRNHDAVLWNSDVFVGIEAKADEELGPILSEAVSGASENKLRRVEALRRMIFDNGVCPPGIRYQLLTALGGVLLEADSRGAGKAVLLILTFLKPGKDDDRGRPYYSERKAGATKRDIADFLELLRWDERTGRVTTPFGRERKIETYIRHITVEL